MSVWEYAENAPEWAEDVRACWSWGLNFDAGQTGNPWLVFLDLIGWTHEHFGEPLAVVENGGVPALCLWEIEYLSDALRAWCARPRDVEEWIDGLHAADMDH